MDKQFLASLLDGTLISCDKKSYFKFPEQPLDQFTGVEQYKKYWDSLIKYEIYHQLFSDKLAGSKESLDEASVITAKSTKFIGFID